METNYSLFRKISDEKLLNKLTEFLNSNEIDFKIDRKTEHTEVQILNSQTLKLESLLMSEKELFMEQEVDDFYLQGFSDKELMDLLTEPENWSAIDYHNAVRILKERGMSVTDEFLVNLRS